MWKNSRTAKFGEKCAEQNRLTTNLLKQLVVTLNLLTKIVLPLKVVNNKIVVTLVKFVGHNRRNAKIVETHVEHIVVTLDLLETISVTLNCVNK